LTHLKEKGYSESALWEHNQLYVGMWWSLWCLFKAGEKGVNAKQIQIWNNCVIKSVISQSVLVGFRNSWLHWNQRKISVQMAYRNLYKTKTKILPYADVTHTKGLTARSILLGLRNGLCHWNQHKILILKLFKELKWNFVFFRSSNRYWLIWQ